MHRRGAKNAEGAQRELLGWKKSAALGALGLGGEAEAAVAARGTHARAEAAAIGVPQEPGRNGGEEDRVQEAHTRDEPELCRYHRTPARHEALRGLGTPSLSQGSMSK